MKILENLILLLFSAFSITSLAVTSAVALVITLVVVAASLLPILAVVFLLLAFL